MELIENKTYYHIQRRVNWNPNQLWEVGQNYFIGQDKNPFFKVFDYGIGNDIGHFYRLTREFIFEEVRKEHFPMFPSRNKCLWVIEDNDENKEYWKQALVNQNTEFRLIKLSLTGKIFKANQQHLQSGNFTLDTWRQKAFRYWAGASGERPEESEVLFEGFAQVVEIVEQG
jgi:hypothetical protein